MMKMKTTDDMGKITLYLLIVTETLSLDHSLVRKHAQTVGIALKCRIMYFDVIFYVLLTSIVLKSLLL